MAASLDRLPQLARSAADNPLVPEKLGVGVDERLMRTSRLTYTLARVSRQFAHRQPQVALDIRQMGYLEVEPAVKEADIDIGISLKHEAEERADLNALVFYQDRLSVLCAADTPKLGIAGLLAENSVLLLTNNPYEQMHMAKLFSALEVFPRLRLESSERISLMKIYCGEGLMLLPETAARGYQDEHLDVRRIEHEQALLFFTLQWGKNNPNPAIPLFQGMLLEQYESE